MMDERWKMGARNRNRSRMWSRKQKRFNTCVGLLLCFLPLRPVILLMCACFIVWCDSYDVCMCVCVWWWGCMFIVSIVFRLWIWIWIWTCAKVTWRYGSGDGHSDEHDWTWKTRMYEMRWQNRMGWDGMDEMGSRQKELIARSSQKRIYNRGLEVALKPELGFLLLIVLSYLPFDVLKKVLD